MKPISFLCKAVFTISTLTTCVSAVRADEKLIVVGEAPTSATRFEVAPDGNKLYFNGVGGYAVLNANGEITDRIGAPGSSRELVPLSDGWFVAANSHYAGQIALYRPDGTQAKVLVSRGGNANSLRADNTGWTTPTGIAVDEKQKRIFVLDTTMAPGGFADPDWSRIAVFDYDGKFLSFINLWDGTGIKTADAKAEDARRTWYDDIEVDPARERVYVTARRLGEVLAFGYDGKSVSNAPGRGGLAVFPDGRIAVGSGDSKTIQIYDADLKPLQNLEVPAAQQLGRAIVETRMDLESDAQGRLYLLAYDEGTIFTRWASDLETSKEFGPRYVRLNVEWPDSSAVSGEPLKIKVAVAGRPQPDATKGWQVLMRPSDGSDLNWQKVATSYDAGVLTATPPANLKGLYEIAVRYGDGPINRADWRNDPFLQRTFALLPGGATRSIAVITANGRRAFVQGETIPLHVVQRGEGASIPATVALEQNGSVVTTAKLEGAKNRAVEISASFTSRLAPGEYSLRPTAAGFESYALRFFIAPRAALSPLQRIMYHEFSGSPASIAQSNLADVPERLAFVRDYVDSAERLGFSRETDRRAWTEQSWRRDVVPADIAAPGYAPSEYYGVPTGSGWEGEYYLDQCTQAGIDFDLQRIGHCGPVCFLPADQLENVQAIQRQAQYFGRFPSFYGYNYNDEMFFGGWDARLGDAPQKWLAAKTEEILATLPATMPEAGRKQRAAADAKMAALDAMYSAFNGAAREANPILKSTTTPMWQFPAVEGSYAPVIYKGMDESYSHYLSEGYAIPWYPAHSVELLRRPGKPMMGVFDNNYSPGDGDLYLKNFMQVAARGVQGVGVQHTPALHTAGDVYNSPTAASAYRVANGLAKMYGSVFAQCPPANEGTILYSYTQDVTETRNMLGTPHFERVFELQALGLMAGAPMGISYEEDVANGVLLDNKKPRTPMLFLVGQKENLPATVRAKISEYITAGGKVFYDADSTEFPGGARLDLQTHQLKDAFNAGYAADSLHPIVQPILEASAQKLKTLLAGQRRFPMETDDPWVSKNRLNGWGIQYLALATETSPFPWSAGEVWSTGAMYNKASGGAYLPRTVQFSFPMSGGVLYDVFDREIVAPKIENGKATIEADLTNFPGRLYALAPAVLAAPKLWLQTSGDRAEYSARIVDVTGKNISARVPLRIRLLKGAKVTSEYFRGTGESGVWKETIALPIGGGAWKLEITELLGGKSSTVALSTPAAPQLFKERPDVEVQRATQIEALLKKSGGTIFLATANDKILEAGQVEALRVALQKRGITLQTGALAPAKPGETRTLLACGLFSNHGLLGEVLLQSWVRGLFDVPLSDNVPGAGRGFVSAVFAPRSYGENAIALVGGDAAGLSKTVDEWVRWLNNSPAPIKATSLVAPPKGAEQNGVLTTVALPRLRDVTGAQLDAVTLSQSGKFLAVSAKGYQRNLALIEDGAAGGKVVRATRIGQAPNIGSLFASNDGKSFGASARTLARWGEGFQLLDAATGKATIFPAFGDRGGKTHRFALSSDGSTLVAPGTHGVVCWKKTGNDGWKEAWSLDGWKEYPKLDWPVSDVDERNPQYHAVIPNGADYALVLYAEKTNQGWIKPEFPGRAWIAALNLGDGKERWRFEVPVPKTLLFPTLYTSADGKRALLQVMMGSWGTETYRFFSLDTQSGKALASWNSPEAPTAATVSSDGALALAFESRLIQVRRADGALVWNLLWHTQPVSLAFEGDKLWLADDAGRLTAFDAGGRETARAETGVVSTLAASPGRIYAAGWDGRLRAFNSEGKPRWKLDLTPALRDKKPMQLALAAAKFDGSQVLAAERPPTTSEKIPVGENLLESGAATITVGGTGGWMSNGLVDIKAEQLINGKTDDVSTPWLNLDEVFWDAQTGRQVWAEITFKTPGDVQNLTVYENPKFPASFPTEAVVQVWDEAQKKWQTAAIGTFLRGAVNTYALNLKGVTKLRYVPMGDYYRNFYTSEIEVR